VVSPPLTRILPHGHDLPIDLYVIALGVATHTAIAQVFYLLYRLRNPAQGGGFDHGTAMAYPNGGGGGHYEAPQSPNHVQFTPPISQ
jgi:hypothetical protein